MLLELIKKLNFSKISKFYFVNSFFFKCIASINKKKLSNELQNSMEDSMVLYFFHEVLIINMIDIVNKKIQIFQFLFSSFNKYVEVTLGVLGSIPHQGTYQNIFFEQYFMF